MGKRRTKTPKLSEQLRQIIEASPLSRYRIAKDSGIDGSQLHRFLKGESRLTTDSLDRLGEVLKLRITSELEQ